jgi:hypothetical protein
MGIGDLFMYNYWNEVQKNTGPTKLALADPAIHNSPLSLVAWQFNDYLVSILYLQAYNSLDICLGRHDRTTQYRAKLNSWKYQFAVGQMAQAVELRVPHLFRLLLRCNRVQALV